MLESAEIVVEVLSPNDESRDKLPFYTSRGVREVWLIEPTRRDVEVLMLDDGRYTEMNDRRSRVLEVDVAAVVAALPNV